MLCEAKVTDHAGSYDAFKKKIQRFLPIHRHYMLGRGGSYTATEDTKMKQQYRNKVFQAILARDVHMTTCILQRAFKIENRTARGSNCSRYNETFNKKLNTQISCRVIFINLCLATRQNSIKTSMNCAPQRQKRSRLKRKIQKVQNGRKHRRK